MPGKKDITTKEFMSNSRNFADAFNLALFGGETVIRAEDLRPLDTDEYAVLFDENGRQDAVERVRDVSRAAVSAMRDQGAAYVLLDLENQAAVHYAMPVRCCLGDALRYAGQVRRITARNRAEKTLHDSVSFLSGLRRTDRLLPVITLVVYWGTDPWDGPRTLREMLTLPDERMARYIGDYRINLLEPGRVPDLETYHESELWKLMRAIAAAGQSREAFARLFAERRIASMENETVRLMNQLLGTKVPVAERGKTDMCEAVREFNNAFALRDEAFALRDEAFAQRDEAFAQRDGAFAQRDGAFALLDRTIAENKKTIAQRDQTIAQRDQTIAQRDQTIAEQKREIAELRARCGLS